MSKGELVVVVDDEDRANDGDLILAAKQATTETNASSNSCLPEVSLG